jgi:hypothetical protein
MEGSQIAREGIYYFASIGVIWNLLDIASSMLVSAFILMNLMGQT